MVTEWPHPGGLGVNSCKMCRWGRRSCVDAGEGHCASQPLQITVHQPLPRIRTGSGQSATTHCMAYLGVLEIVFDPLPEVPGVACVAQVQESHLDKGVERAVGIAV